MRTTCDNGQPCQLNTTGCPDKCLRATSIDLGDGRILTWKAYAGDPHSACEITHTRPDGSPCHKHWCPIKGGAWESEFPNEIPVWNIVQAEPLTLSPSILCLNPDCCDHGFVENGKWRKV